MAILFCTGRPWPLRCHSVLGHESGHLYGIGHATIRTLHVEGHAAKIEATWGASCSVVVEGKMTVAVRITA
jgi:hypothetical protein